VCSCKQSLGQKQRQHTKAEESRSVVKSFPDLKRKQRFGGNNPALRTLFMRAGRFFTGGKCEFLQQKLSLLCVAATFSQFPPRGFFCAQSFWFDGLAARYAASYVLSSPKAVGPVVNEHRWLWWHLEAKRSNVAWSPRTVTMSYSQTAAIISLVASLFFPSKSPLPHPTKSYFRRGRGQGSRAGGRGVGGGGGSMW